MKSILITIFTSLISGIFIFFKGKDSAKKEIKIEQLKQEIKDNKENVKINKNINSMSLRDKSNFLLSRQQNHKGK